MPKQMRPKGTKSPLMKCCGGASARGEEGALLTSSLFSSARR